MPRLQPLVDMVIQARGWRRLGFLFFAGILLTLAMPPVGAWPLAFISLGLFFLSLISASSYRQSSVIGFWYGFGFCLTSFYWIAISLLVDAAQFGWLIPFAVFGLNAALALFWVLFAVGFYALRNLPDIVKPLIFALFWFGMEWLRSTILTGFPWNLLATIWASYDVTLQPLYWLGAYGYGALTAFLAACMALPFLPSASLVSFRHSTALFATLTVIALLAIGQWRLVNAHTKPVENIQLRIVQASIPQNLKWDPASRAEGVKKHIALSQQASSIPPTHIIWPESAVPYVLEENTPLMDALRAAVPAGGVLMTGSLRVGGREGTKALPPLYNSLQVVDESGRVVAHYDKEHLVPFGEYIPLRGWIPLEQKITAGMQDFARGYQQPNLAIPRTPAALPLICYEVIFPREIAVRKQNAKWAVNVTNDAWFGHSSGPYQHLAMARMRAVEQGISVVRAANNGISAVIDPYGRILKQLDYNSVGVIDSHLPVMAKN